MEKNNTNITDEQQQLLQKFRIHVNNQNLTVDQYPDSYLLRFLRARKYDYEKTITMWNAFIKWQEQVKYDEIKNYQYSEIDNVRSLYPHGYQGIDKFGHPIYYEKIGRVDINKLFKATTQERYVTYQIQQKYILLNKIFPNLFQKKQQVCVVIGFQQLLSYFNKLKLFKLKIIILCEDLIGISYANYNSGVLNFIKITNEISQNYFPELLNTMFIINAPSIFSIIWAAIKKLLDDQVQKKIQILGSNYKEQLFKQIDENQLLVSLGGNNPDCLSQNKGPWNPLGFEFFYFIYKILWLK